MAEEVASRVEADAVPQRGLPYGNTKRLVWIHTASSHAALEIGGLKQPLLY